MYVWFCTSIKGFTCNINNFYYDKNASYYMGFSTTFKIFIPTEGTRITYNWGNVTEVTCPIAKIRGFMNKREWLLFFILGYLYAHLQYVFHFN